MVIMTLILKHDDVFGILTPDEVREAVLAGLREQAAGQVQVPPRTTIDSTSNCGWLRVMPVIMNGSGVMGYKAMHSTPGEGVRYLVMLYDMASGQLSAQLDADWLTSQRTAATAAIATDILSSKTITQVGVLGSSEQARAMLVAVSRVRTLSVVKVYSPTRANRIRFAEDMSERLGLTVIAADTPDAVFDDSNLVLSVFRAGTVPLIKPEWLRPGLHLSAGSSVRPEARELTDQVWARCNAVVLDDREHAFESGDGRSAIASKVIAPENCIELYELTNPERAGRRRDDNITLFKGVGTALQDLALAQAIYARARSRGLGQAIDNFPRPRR